jgi:hypothetical protein
MKLAAVLLLLLVGCAPSSVGRPCQDPKGDIVRGTQLSTPALECPSRVCLLSQAVVDGGVPRAYCTAGCDSDGDCAAEGHSQCAGRFRCAVPREVGDLCCQKLCVCEDDLALDAQGSVVMPASCDPMSFGGALCPACPSVTARLPAAARARCSP